MDNRLALFALLSGLMLLLGCTGQADNTKAAAPGAPAPDTGENGAKPAPGGASAFPSDIDSDAGFNDTYGELDAVK